MTLFKKVMLLWSGLLGVFGLSLFLPHEGLSPSSFISYSLQLLLFIISLYLIKHESVKKNKNIFVNFAIFFGFSFFFHIYNFVGTVIFAGDQFARFLLYQYVSLGAYFFFLAFAIVYLAIDALFRDFKTLQKYLICLTVVGGFFGYYYSPYFTNPRYLYTTDDVMDWKIMNEYVESHQIEGGRLPSQSIIAESIELYSWRNGKKVGVLYPDEKLERVLQLYPYLEHEGYKILILKPLYLNTIRMCVVSIGFILLFFGYQYKKDPPQGAYIEKMMFLFLVFCTMEVFHAWSFIKSIEWGSFYEILNMSQYISTAILLFIAVFFGLRLHFITTVKGEFYENEIRESPGSVTRWRDAIDNMVLAHFFNKNAILGRMFVESGNRRGT